jgi:multiple sugar transport system substrate-binding protein
MSRRDFIRIGALATAGTALAACAPQVVTEVVKETVKETVEVEVTREVEGEPQVTTIVEQAESIVITVHDRMGWQGDMLDHFAHQFNEEHHPDIFVRTDHIPYADYFQKINTMIAGGTIGDSFNCWIGGGNYEQYSASGVYIPLDPVIESSSYDLGVFYPEAIEELRVQNNLFALPYSLNIGSGSIVFYLKPLFDQAGVEYPTADWTWDELIQTAITLTNHDEGIWGLRTENYYAGTPITLARAYGGDLLSKDGTETNLDNPNTLAGLQIFGDLYQVYKVSPSTSEISGYYWQDFAAGTLAMYQTGFWGKGVEDFVAPGTWGAVPSPKGPKGRGNQFTADTFGVTSASQHPAETFDFLTTIVSYDAGMYVWQVSKSVPGCRPDVINSEAALADPFLKAVVTDVVNEEGIQPKLPCPANFRENEYWQVITEGLEPIWSGETASVEEIVSAMAATAQQVLDRPSLI